MKIDVRHNLGNVELFYKTLSGNVKSKALVRTLNRTATTVRAEASRQIRERYNLKSASAKERILVRNATAETLKAVIAASGRPIPIAEFSARQSSRGARFTIIKGKPQTLAHAFVATMRSGHRGVYQRRGSKRLPIAEKYTIGVPQMFTQRKILAALVTVAEERFPRVFEQEARYYLSKG